MSENTDRFDPREFRRQIGQYVASRRDQGLRELNVGQCLLDVSRQAREDGLFVPTELVLLGKTLLQLDEVGRILDPDFDPNASIRRNAGEITSTRMGREASQGGVVRSLLELKDFTVNLPSRLNRIMDAVANAELELKVKVPDAKIVVDGIEKVANRITNGILLAALIIGAALMMRIETRWTLFGYPGFAMLCFLGAAIGALFLLYNIYSQDRKGRKNRPR
jgi:predicted unusual protein kinase regulating ubiquinone biosynthesis (AarF/ABC1/UbiB family)